MAVAPSSTAVQFLPGLVSQGWDWFGRSFTASVPTLILMTSQVWAWTGRGVRRVTHAAGGNVARGVMRAVVRAITNMV